jgi:membrane protease YdiL (CAAX protease family)
VFLAYLLVQGAVLAFFPSLLRPDHFGAALAATTLAATPIGSLLLWRLAALRRGLPVRDYLGLRLPTTRQALVSLALLALFNLTYDQLTRFLHRPLIPDFMRTSYRSAHGLPWLYLAVIVAAPVFEELLFRGFLLPGLRPTLGAGGAALLSSVAFALPHLQYDAFDVASVCVLGLLFAGVRLSTGSTLLTILLHLITNLVAMLQVAWVLSHSA